MQIEMSFRCFQMCQAFVQILRYPVPSLPSFAMGPDFRHFPRRLPRRVSTVTVQSTVRGGSAKAYAYAHCLSSVWSVALHTVDTLVQSLFGLSATLMTSAPNMDEATVKAGKMPAKETGERHWWRMAEQVRIIRTMSPSWVTLSPLPS